MSKAWEGGSTTAWRRLRRLVLQRDGYLCQLRFEGCTTIATQAHHTKPWTGRPEHTPLEHLAAACRNCNTKAGEPKGDPRPIPRTRW